jgi:hypothetical protein
MVTVAASYAIIRSRSGSTPASRRYGSSGTFIILTPISTSIASASDAAYVSKYSSISSQPLFGSTRPPYSAKLPYRRCRRLNGTPRCAR